MLSVVTLFLARTLLQEKASANQTADKTEAFQNQTINIDKTYSFSGLDDKGKKKDKIELKITEVEKTDQVVVQDKTYTAQNEKVFLIVNFELKNDSTTGLNIFPGDLLRLIVDDNEEKKYAPDLHNNFVLVAPLSTKVDRVGFVVLQKFENLKLQVGELEGEKEVIEIKFPTWQEV